MERPIDSGIVMQAESATRTDTCRWLVELARPDDDSAIRDLLRRQAMGGRVRVSLQREPCADWAAQIEGDRHFTAVLRDRVEGRLVGVGQRTVRRVWFNGEIHRLGYLGLLRRDDTAHGRVRALAEGFALLAKTRAADELPFDLTSVIADNDSARRLLERAENARRASSLPAFPHYEPIARWVTVMLPVSPSYGRTHARAARPEEMPMIADTLKSMLRQYQFAPVWEVEDLVSPIRCRGFSPSDFLVIDGANGGTGDSTARRACAAVWDQRDFKQTVIAGYSPPIARWRGAINLWRRLRGDPALPADGMTLAMAYLSHLAVAEDDAAGLIDMVRAAMAVAAGRGIEYLATGFVDGHPHLDTLRRFFRGHEYVSNLYLVKARNETAPGIHGAEVSESDGRRVHVETATL